MSENLKQGLINCAMAVLFCLAVAILIDRVGIIYSMLDTFRCYRTEAVEEAEFGERDY